MIRIIVLICVALSTFLVTGVSVRGDRWFLTVVSLSTGIFWVCGELRDIKHIAAPGMASMILLSALLGVYDTTPILLACVVILALSAWDLSRLHHRIQHAISNDIRLIIERKHLLRLLLVDCIGFVPVLVFSEIQFHINFIVFFVLATVTLVAIFMVTKLTG